MISTEACRTLYFYISRCGGLRFYKIYGKLMDVDVKTSSIYSVLY
jgi:hypothetical protein